MKVLLLICLVIASCTGDKSNMLADDIRLYKGSPAWELAKAVEHDRTGKIKEIISENKILLNYQEEKFGMSLLNWAVYNDHFESAKTLAELGADPNLQDSSGTSAFIQGADNYETSDYVRLLLKHGGDVNAVAKSQKQRLRTPLIAAAFQRIESVQLLVEAGANIDYRSDEYESALKSACLGSKIDIIRYLVIDKKGDYKTAIGYTAGGDSSYVKEWIDRMTFSDKREETLRQEVLEYMEKH